jgi:hypothetical protein
MLRMKYFAGLTVVLAAGLLSVQVAAGTDAAGQAPPASGERWDDGGPLVGQSGQLALMQGDKAEEDGPRGMPGFRRPGPPPGLDDGGRGPGGRGPGVGRRAMPGPPGRGGPDEIRGPGPGGMMFGDQPGGPRGPNMFRNCEWGFNIGGKFDTEMMALTRKDDQLNRESRELAAKYSQAAPDKRESIKKELDELVNKQFDVRRDRRNLELKQLEESLQRLRDTVDRREKARKAIVDKRVLELLGTEQELDF